MAERRLPPVTQLGAASMAFVAAGVIYIAAYLPKHAPIGIAIGCLACAAALLVVTSSCSRARPSSRGGASSR